MPTVEVTCPEGMSEGEVLHVEYEGASFAVHVPPGVQCGYTFAVELETAATQQPEPEPEYEVEPADAKADELETASAATAGAAAQALESEPEAPIVSKPAAVPGATAASLSVLMAAVAQRRLSPANAQALIIVMVDPSPVVSERRAACGEEARCEGRSVLASIIRAN